MSMEGVLLKWTNYMSGWQQRYFILRDGTLAYYNSKEDMTDGCKRSVQLAFCDVNVHSSDLHRFDLILGDQRFYLRALSQAERQRWVIALESYKMASKSPVCVNLRLSEPEYRSIVDRQSELRLYHHLLVQQIKELQGNLKEDTVPDMQRVNEITGTLNAACSTFLVTLDELLSLTRLPNWSSARNTSLDFYNDPASVITSNRSSIQQHSQFLPDDNTNCLNFSQWTHSGTKSRSIHRWFPSSPLFGDQKHRISPIAATLRTCDTFFSRMEFSFEQLQPTASIVENDVDQCITKLPGDYLSANEFIQACRSFFSIFDQVVPHSCNKTSMKHIQADILSNLDRLNLAIQMNDSGPVDLARVMSNSNGSDSTNLQKLTNVSIGALLRMDVYKGFTKDEGCVYMAILWLSRSLNFVREFIHLLFILPPPTMTQPTTTQSNDTKDESLIVAATEAYSRCLRPFHSWSMRGVAMIVIKSLPTRAWLTHVLLDNAKIGDDTAFSDLFDKPDVYSQLQLDAQRFSEAIGRTLALIEGLLMSFELDRIFTGFETY